MTVDSLLTDLHWSNLSGRKEVEEEEEDEKTEGKQEIKDPKIFNILKGTTPKTKNFIFIPPPAFYTGLVCKSPVVTDYPLFCSIIQMVSSPSSSTSYHIVQ